MAAEPILRTRVHDPEKYTTNVRGELAETFTGADIKALIIRRDDITLIKAAQEYLTEVLKASSVAQSNADLPISVSTDFLDRMNIDPTDDQAQHAKLTPLVNLQAITVSTFRSKTQVRALGQVNPRGIARGSRTIGGTLILTEFDRDTFWNLIALPLDPVPAKDWNVGDVGESVVPDQLPAFDILLLFANERGANAYRMLYEVELVTNGIVYSIQDMYNENTLSFLCTDMTPLIPLPNLNLQSHGKLSTWAGEMIAGNRTPTRIRPFASILSGKEVLRRYRLLKASRDPFK